jgi:hypothetical protein
LCLKRLYRNQLEEQIRVEKRNRLVDGFLLKDRDGGVGPIGVRKVRPSPLKKALNLCLAIINNKTMSFTEPIFYLLGLIFITTISGHQTMAYFRKNTE